MLEILTIDQLYRLPPPKWLITEFIEQNSISALYGQSGTAKSFIALDWSLSVATGRPWLGRIPVVQSPVLYIAAEGGRSIQKRVRAWSRHHGLKAADLNAAYWSVKPLYVRDREEVEQLFELLDHMDTFPGLLVIDTLSQSFGAGDENSMDMQEFVGAVTEIRNQRQMAVLIVHHTNAMGKRERGHSSFRGGMDHMFETTAQKDEDFRLQEVTLLNNKQKDTETQAKLTFTPHKVLDSLVLVEGIYGGPVADQPVLVAKGSLQQVLNDPAIVGLHAQAVALGKMTNTTFAAAKKRLQRYYVIQDKKRGTE